MTKKFEDVFLGKILGPSLGADNVIYGVSLFGAEGG